MAVPKKKTSKSKRNMRRSHHALSKTTVVESQSGELARPHHVCLDGTYNGRQVIVETEDLIEDSE